MMRHRSRNFFINQYNGSVKCYPQNTLLFWGPGESHALYQNEPQSIHCSFLIQKDDFASICERYHPDNPELITLPFAECYLSAEKAAYLAGISAKGLTQKEDAEEFLQLFLHIAISHLFFENPEPDKNKYFDVNACISDILLKFESPDYLTIPITKLYALYPVCKATLIKAFKDYTGHTIVEYRNIKRMEYSAMLLSTQRLSCTQVSSRIGISSFSYFSKLFYEYYGVVPSKYSHKYYQFPSSVSQHKPDGHAT